MFAARGLLAQRHLATLICVATLLLKLLVPTGYMLGTEQGRIAITICTGFAHNDASSGMTGMHGDRAGHGKSKDHGKTEMPCAFSGLSAAVLGAVDPILLVGLVAFIMALGLCPVVIPAPLKRTYLRPPLRGPPASL
ncbi:DUF2946 family protein [Sphingomonas sp. BE138]|uniref:DUF2946 family protein n=1 Tax=Sphingomonas sp. BE138 TaxID=2817845 RepID=UPI00386CD67F